MIQESKYLGGDMEHTHLVKGLDFALLQKVRSEILNREKVEKEKKEQEEIEIDEESEDPKPTKKSKNQPKTSTAEPPKEVVKIDREESKIMCKTVLAKNIVKTIFNTEPQEKNELFFPGRMAYIVELEEDLTESSTVTDIPTTIIRSKADIQAGNSSQQSLSSSTNDIVINKLTQILSYLRAGKHNKKKKNRELKNEMVEKMLNQNPEKKPEKVSEDIPIYDDIGDYVPGKKDRSDRDRDRRDRDRDRYGDRDRDRDRDRRDRDQDRRDRDRYGDRRDHRDRDRDRDRKSRFDQDRKGSSRYFDKDEREDVRSENHMSGEDRDLLKKLIKREEEKSKREEAKKINAILEPDHYAECYPGMSEMNDAIDDSDEEADYTKMDLVSDFVDFTCQILTL